jgi:exportin-7
MCAQDYPKLSQNYYGLLECLAQDHMTFVSSLEPQVFLYILSTISEGLVALGESCPLSQRAWLL